MTVRVCPECGSGVTTDAGVCVRGHRFRPPPPPPSLSELRAEVERAFEDARLQVAAAVTTGQHRPAQRSVAEPVSVSSDLPVPPVPPPPPVREEADRVAAVWARLAPQDPDERDLRSDPITAFAPAPNMDWGPERIKRKRRSQT